MAPTQQQQQQVRNHSFRKGAETMHMQAAATVVEGRKKIDRSFLQKRQCFPLLLRLVLSLLYWATWTVREFRR